jgi:ketosteroid isomerase-like protein
MKQSLPIFLMILLALGPVGAVDAQDAEQAAKKKQKATSGELYDTIARADLQVCDAFNAHDVDALMAMFTDDLEFYDDGSGVKDFERTKGDFTAVFENVPDLRRELMPGTLEVYPLQGYGAIELGEHRFCHEENGKRDCGIMKFSMVWRQIGQTWKLARVLSYAH